MDKKEIKDFFDRLAPAWDAEQTDRSEEIEKIIDGAGIEKGSRVLDVACGTGVMFPYYLRRGAASVTGVDISAEMVRIAREKFAAENAVAVVCADVEDKAACKAAGISEESFDAVVLHNAFPHFPDSEKLIKRLTELTRIGGRLTIAHSFSREKINEHHSGSAKNVSVGLISADELADIMSGCLQIETVISDDEMYQVTGLKLR